LYQPHLSGILVTLRQTLLLVNVALLISYSVDVPESVTGKILNAPPMIWLGMLSYSLYLWQQPFCTMVGGEHVFQRFPLNIFVSLLAAAFSYYVVERSFNKLKGLVRERKEAPKVMVAVGAGS